MINRESTRIRDAEKKRVIDQTARQRRQRKALEALEKDNIHKNPHAGVVKPKSRPFQDCLESTEEEENKEYKKIKLKRGALAKYRRNIHQLVEEEKGYTNIQAPPPKEPRRYFCTVCGNFSKYRCTACGARYCSVACVRIHKDTRCLNSTMALET